MAYSLSFSKSILVLAFISDKIRRGETEYISTKVISDLLNIPKPTLSVIFNNLIRAGILESKEGINGGVRFAKNPEQITLLDILTAIENQKSLFQTSFELNVKSKRPDDLKNAVTDALNNIENEMKTALTKTTLKDILDELDKPGRDPRKKFAFFEFTKGVNQIEDLKEGMKLSGIVTNITAFGAFVDIGVHQDGLVHISCLADEFISDPNTVVKINQKVDVKVLEVDIKRKRIQLSMKECEND